MASKDSVAEVFMERQLHAKVSRTCPHCGAPGHWHDDPTCNSTTYDPEKKRAADMRFEGFASVGKICPNCGKERPDVEDHGMIWSQKLRAPTTWERIKAKFTGGFK